MDGQKGRRDEDCHDESAGTYGPHIVSLRGPGASPVGGQSTLFHPFVPHYRAPAAGGALGKALAHVMENIDVRILPDELIVGRGGPEGRYGILYPELEGAYFATAGSLLESAEDMPHHFSEQDIAVIRDELLPFWAGRTFRESLADAVPLHLRRLLYKDGDIYVPSFIIHETATVRHSLQWVLDYGKVLQRGFCGIYQEAARRLDALDINDPSNNWDKAPFYRAVMILCEGIRSFACRYAALARQQAAACGDAVRREELERIAAICEHVPWQPARTFHEALQAQWFTQLVSRLEQLHGGIISNGRMDQYLYPFLQEGQGGGPPGRRSGPGAAGLPVVEHGAVRACPADGGRDSDL